MTCNDKEIEGRIKTIVNDYLKKWGKIKILILVN